MSSRLSYSYEDNGDDLFPDKENKPEYIVLADFDTIIYWVLYETNEDGSRRELGEEDLPFLEGKMNEIILKILNKVEERVIIKSLYIFIRGSKNFRKDLLPSYKSNRPEKHILTDRLYDFMIKTFNAKPSRGCEAEDEIYTAAKLLNYNCIVLHVDHDLLEIPCIFYNYKKETWKKQTEKQALFEKYKKLIVSEAGDNVNLAKGLGKRHFEKFYNPDMTIEEYEAQALLSYIKVWKEEEKAKEMLELCKKLVWLQDVEELNKKENGEI